MATPTVKGKTIDFGVLSASVDYNTSTLVITDDANSSIMVRLQDIGALTGILAWVGHQAPQGKAH